MPASPVRSRRSSTASRFLAALGAATLLGSLIPVAIGSSVLASGSPATPGAGPVAASHTPDPTSVTIAGNLQPALGCPSVWLADCAATHLVYDANDQVWQGSFNVPAGSWEYKAALNDSWIGRASCRERVFVGV